MNNKAPWQHAPVAIPRQAYVEVLVALEQARGRAAELENRRAQLRHRIETKEAQNAHLRGELAAAKVSYIGELMKHLDVAPPLPPFYRCAECEQSTGRWSADTVILTGCGVAVSPLPLSGDQPAA